MAIVLRDGDPDFNVVTDYYNVCHREPLRNGTLTTYQVVPIPNMTFRKLIQTMIALRQREYLVVCHGNENGLGIPISGKQNQDPNGLLAEVTVRVDLNQLKEAITLQEWANRAGNNLEEWLRVVNPIAKPDQLSVIRSNRDVRFGQKILNDWVHSRQTIGLSRAGLSGLVRDLITLRQSSLQRVEIRGCNIGKKKETLDILREVFGARYVGAPILDMFYVPVRPHFPNAIANFLQTPFATRRVYGDPQAPVMVLDIRQVSHASYQAETAVNQRADIAAAATLLVPGFKGSGNSFVVAGMWRPGTWFSTAADGSYQWGLQESL